jgi:hypothetical protein
MGMQEQMGEQDLKDRLNLIENMIAEGRRTTESWGWVFVLWGVAYYVAIVWAAWGRGEVAWPVTMIAASVLTGVLASRKSRRGHETTIGRAISAVWISMGISLFVILVPLGMTGKYESHLFVAIIGAMLGTANATSSMILRWKAQFACALVWWAATLISCIGSERQSVIAFLVAIFLCQIVFGIYGMMGRSHRRGQGALHA